MRVAAESPWEIWGRNGTRTRPGDWGGLESPLNVPCQLGDLGPAGNLPEPPLPQACSLCVLTFRLPSASFVTLGTKGCRCRTRCGCVPRTPHPT